MRTIRWAVLVFVWAGCTANSATAPERDVLADQVQALQARVESLEADVSPDEVQSQMGVLSHRVDTIEQHLRCDAWFRGLGPRAEPRLDTHRIPSSLRAMATPAVARAATKGALKWWTPDNGARHANYMARDAAFGAAAQLGRHELFHDTYDGWRLRLLELARQDLSRPSSVKSTYRTAKPAIVDEIRKAEKASDIAGFIRTRVLPSMTADKLTSSQAAWQQVSEADRLLRATPYRHECWKLASERMKEADQALGLETHDAYVTQWMLRRRGEGGDALVDAWREVLVDLAETLESR